MTATSQLRLLALKENFVYEHEVYRLEKGWTLHFTLDHSLINKNVRVFTNHPKEGKAGSNRHKYRELKWENLSQSKGDVYDNFAAVNMVLAGSFNFYFTLDGSDKWESRNTGGVFLVDPVLTVGQYDEKLALDSIACQTVLAKSMGPLNSWLGRLKVAKECGYNMIHFTPLQELGESRSAYCIKDQLKLNPMFSTKETTHDFSDVEKIVVNMRKEWDMLSVTDLVFNHTANESPWLLKHPECAFNLINSPHLKPAYLLDRIIYHFNRDIAHGKFADRGLPAELCSEDQLNVIHHIFSAEILPKHKLHEFYLMHIDNVVQEFRLALLSDQKGMKEVKGDLEIIPDAQFRRLQSSVNIPLAIAIHGKIHGQKNVDASCDQFRRHLEHLNHVKYEEIQSHLDAATNNMIANARWRFVNPHGDKLGVVKEKEPIMWNYFTIPKPVTNLAKEEATMFTDKAAFCMAHNGWVMGDDPLKNFAEPGSNVYLRRELIPWGDNVKLRYGQKAEDCPFLWQQMKNYAVQAATIFDGVRLDNCHSTPLHVAEYMLDEARKVRPDLYVTAELFTNSKNLDSKFINRLGLTSLIRESLQCGNINDTCGSVFNYGGWAVGAFMQPPARPLVPTGPHAIFFDQTHDNESPMEKRSAYDLLTNSAIVAMTCCASGSNRGYDEMVPHHINVVKEERLYNSWSDNVKPNSGLCSSKTGIVAAKFALNKLHAFIGGAGFSQRFAEVKEHGLLIIKRHNPVSHQSVILVCRPVYSEPHDLNTGYLPPIHLEGEIEEVILEGKLSHIGGSSPFKKDKKFINGLQNFSLYLAEHIKVKSSKMVRYNENSKEHIEFTNFPPGSIAIFKVTLNAAEKNRILKLRQILSCFGYRMRTFSARNLAEISSSELEAIICKLSLNDINRVLYRCDAEERDDGKGFGAYGVPGHGVLTYCGLQGIVSVLSETRTYDNLGHPLFANLREGPWLMDYIANRLIPYPGTNKLGLWFQKVFEPLKLIPSSLIPTYFDAIVTGVYLLVEEVAWAKMSRFVSEGSTFVRALAMGSIQFTSFVPTARLPILSANLAEPTPPMIEIDGRQQQACATLCAGLPHFAAGIWRNWGRDTMIAMRGMLLLTGRFDDARFILLGYAGTLRHGLIPNLLGSGESARFNCRDSIWFWLMCIQEYCTTAPKGISLLNETVSRYYPTDTSSHTSPVDQPLHKVIQEALQRHATGVKYRERDAGPIIDQQMNDQVIFKERLSSNWSNEEGFNNEIGVDWNTGFVFGGNEHNCGTWMDKMGSASCNKGVPATPRCGSAVELVGLCKYALTWLAEVSKSGHYKYSGVERVDPKTGKKSEISWSDWASLIQKNFEKHFWINTKPVPANEPRPDLINRRGIYKDTHGATPPWTDYQLRPNMAIAMCVAPELFTPEYAWHAIAMMSKILMGPLGIKTLDPSDYNYNGNYNNNDGTDGFNYHQGPEWVWLVGYFLRAKLIFAAKLEKSQKGTLGDAISYIKNVMSRHRIHCMTSYWRSLPELTNENGSHCHGSCEAQAWSVGCLLEVLADLDTLIGSKK